MTTDNANIPGRAPASVVGSHGKRKTVTKDCGGRIPVAEAGFWRNAQQCASDFAQTSKNDVADCVSVHNVSNMFRVKPYGLSFRRCHIHYRERNTMEKG
ncbi:hypothetical protein, partial [Bifidobacterium sp. UTBIF-78]|uniref:hypothetical protein n=1 Tax=Bifidobacterium sp. UTBIF-78 TaxID=1465263 RepID=UPI001C6169DE